MQAVNVNPDSTNTCNCLFIYLVLILSENYLLGEKSFDMCFNHRALDELPPFAYDLLPQPAKSTFQSIQMCHLVLLSHELQKCLIYVEQTSSLSLQS